jgi:hypothetical protein
MAALMLISVPNQYQSTIDARRWIGASFSRRESCHEKGWKASMAELSTAAADLYGRLSLT